MSDGQQQTSGRLAVLMFTDVVGSVELKNRLGVLTYARLLARHDELFRQLIAECPSAEVLQDTGDGYFTAFHTVSDAVRIALRFQDAMHREHWDPEPLRTRIGVHLGELAHIVSATGGPPKVVGMAADVAARLMSLARGGQILLTRAAFDEARQFISEYPATNGDPGKRALRWMAHGDYVFQGATDPIEVFEVGGDGIAPLSPPRDREKARRSLVDGKDEILGWRPGVGLAVPQTPAWVLEKKLGEGTFGEVWLAQHATLRQSRVFKFCFDAVRLESFKRELTLFRLLRDALGERPDIARLHDVCFDRPPFFLETEYAPAGNLIDWSAAQGGLDHVPLETRLEIVAQVCDAVAAAHSVGVLHKDIKPSNILMHEGRNGAPPRPQLADFGIGLLTDKGQLAAHHITEAGFTSMDTPAESSRSGTRIYMPPEAMVGRPFTIQGDIYALGILLYQMAIADLERPVALGWERDVDDELLREDIAACVDGDPARRANSATEIAERLRQLPQRREQRAAERRHRNAAMRRHRLFKLAAVSTVVLLALSAVAIVGFFRERQERLRAEASERATQLARADGACEQGTALHLAGRGRESRDAFLVARDTYLKFNHSTLVPDVGLYRSFREFEAPINTIAAHDKGVTAVAWLEDGVRACSASLDGTVRMWDVRTGERQPQRFEGHTKSVLCMAISPDRKRLITGSADETIRTWDIETGAPLHVMKAGGEVRGVAFSPDGKLALSASRKQGSARLWDVETGTELWSTLEEAAGDGESDTPRAREDFFAVAFSPDGQRFVTTSYNDTIVVRDTARRQKLQQSRPHVGIVTCAVFLDDERLLSAGVDGTVRLSELSGNSGSSNVTRKIAAHAAGIRALTPVRPDSTADGGPAEDAKAVACDLDGGMRLWNLKTGEVSRSFAGHVGAIAGIAVSPRGDRLLTAGLGDNTIRVWDLGRNRDAFTVQDAQAFLSVACSPDGLLIVSGDNAGMVTVRDAATLYPLRIFSELRGSIDCVRVLADGRRLFAADCFGAARLWDIFTGESIATYAPPRAPTTTGMSLHGREWCYSAVDPGGRLAVSTSADRRGLDVWPLTSGDTSAQVSRRTIGPAPDADELTCVAISPDGARALTGTTGGMTHQWDLASGRVVSSCPAREKGARVDRVIYSPDGRRALIGGHDAAVQLWDLTTRTSQPMIGHTQPILALGFAPDGRFVYSAGIDQTLRMWNPETGEDLGIGAQLQARSYDLAVLPNGAAVCSRGKRLTVLDPARVLRYLNYANRLPSVRSVTTTAPTDAASLAALGEWYAFRGVNDWAISILEQARDGGARVPAITLARCYWQVDRPADAARVFRNAINEDAAPRDYLNKCLNATTIEARATLPSPSK